jgi:hypothetical protein
MMAPLTRRGEDDMHISVFVRRRMRSVFALLLIVLLAAPIARATTVAKMTFSEVVAGAELIAIGTVSAIEQTWDTELEMPFTHVTFSDLEVLKGSIGGEDLTLRFLGGPAPDGLTLVVTGMPQFALRDRAAVFSTGNGVQACPLVGWWQGLYRVVFDAVLDAFTVADHVGRSVVAFDGGPGQRIARFSAAPEATLPEATLPEATLPEALTLENFKTLIQAEAQ